MRINKISLSPIYQLKNKKTNLNPITKPQYDSVHFTSKKNYFLAAPIIKWGKVKGVTVQFPLYEETDKQQSMRLEFNKDEVPVLFYDDNTLNSEAIEHFVELFKERYLKTVNQMSEIEKYLTGIINDTTSKIDPDDESVPEEVKCIQDALFELDDIKARKEIAQNSLEGMKEGMSEEIIYIARWAQCVLQLCQDEDGFDFSDLAKNKIIAQSLIRSSEEYI